ncbi:hypothetical protein HAV22_23225 [Massilia sp. TW-1]|uniref:Uncharacterized protein n=1 Tax=Telluria antibiotica TaxID=2717319 RepID=A0ABX0PJE5_9BURK|nr:hypothetical protein [Telluria antibiotica]NIA56544.1 hypothetical protein [Telluria antibiotica]
MSSSRRATGDINILALLDGQSRGRRFRARPVFWYGTAGVLACSLLVALAWLVRSATPPRHTGTAGASASAVHEVHTTVAPGGGTAAHASAFAIEHDVNAALAAETSAQPHASLRPVAEPGAQSNAPVRGAVIVDLAGPTSPPSMATTAPVAPPHTIPGPTSSRAQPPAVHHPVARPQPGYRTVTNQAPVLAHASSVPFRPKRAAPKTPAPTVTVDTDVALISAILQHTGAPHEAATEGAVTPPCADKSCGPHMPSRQ